MSLTGALAANRFGLGAKPGEIARASGDPPAWLLDQLADSALEEAFADLSGTRDLTAKLIERYQAGREKDQNAIKAFQQGARGTYLREMAARFSLGAATDQPFRERLVRFWSNHFTVSIQKAQTALLIGAFERDAIRPYVTGKFSDMLLAVVRHPAMLLYLDNAQSIGPDSMAGERRGKGRNENLGREILELHTLGVDGGYSQNDVIALANILTGWSLDREGSGNDGFKFYDRRHEPGTQTLLGKTYPSGYDGGVQALNDLAHHPATARHIATKLAVHFAGDSPQPGSIKRIESAFRVSGGDLKVVAKAIVADPAAWKKEQDKVRSPVDYITAALRAAGGDKLPAFDDKKVSAIVAAARAMGEAPFGAPSPRGWPDTSDAWTGADALLERVEWANAAAAKLGVKSDPVMLADSVLGPLLTPQTKLAISRAASSTQGLALLFASPEFQRR